jgi:hypothetical protein
MKTIALSMILSLAVIVCEQQTLFAPHFVSFAKAPQPTNSLVPIAGVNRSVPLAGTSNYCRNNWCVSGGDATSKNRNSSRAIVHPEYSPSGPDRKPKNDVWVVDTGVGLTGNRASGPDRKPTVVEQPVHGPHRLVFDGLSGRIQGGISEENDADGYSAFLPWHRGYSHR